MRVHSLHPWNLSPSDAVRLQKELRSRLRTEGRLRPEDVRLVAGVDVSIAKDDPVLTAGVVVLEAASLRVVETTVSRLEPPMPYIPGLLSFREIPALIPAIEALSVEPDVFLVDGQGIAHPRRMGIAAHLGLVLDRPAIGIAKSRLCGEAAEPGPQRGSWMPLLHRGEEIGRLLRTKERVAPVIVSPGHRIDMESALAIALQFARGYRLPEPTRLAHLHVNEARRAAGSPQRPM